MGTRETDKWREQWTRDKVSIAVQLAEGKCGGSYSEGAILLCTLISGLSAEVWPGYNKDRKRFVQLLALLTPPELGAKTVSVPLLIGALRKVGRNSESQLLNAKFMKFHDTHVLTGPMVDRSEDEIIKACATVPLKMIRENSYSNLLYGEIRTPYAHEYRHGKRADFHPTTGKRDVGVSYGNWINDPDRHIHFHLPWIAMMAISAARSVDHLPILPSKDPLSWWID